MQQFDTRNKRKNLMVRPRLKEKLIYLPGAMIMLYGLWLSLTL